MKTETYTLPSFWASYFINGDASGLLPEEKAQADKFLHDNSLPMPVSCDDAGFRWKHGASDYGVLACDCQNYTFLLNPTDEAK